MEAPYIAGNGHFYTAAIFLEAWKPNQFNNSQVSERPVEAVFSLNGEPGYIDARATFLELEDPTGYKWAIQYLKSWKHFVILMRSDWFKDAVDSWVDELKLILKARAIQKLVEIASGASPQALQAAKYLAAAEWEKAATGRGRPSREVVKGELAKTMKALRDTQGDAERMGLKVVQGDKQ